MHYTLTLALPIQLSITITCCVLHAAGKPVLEEAGGESKGKNATEAPLSPGSWTGNQVLPPPGLLKPGLQPPKWASDGQSCALPTRITASVGTCLVHAVHLLWHRPSSGHVKAAPWVPASCQQNISLSNHWLQRGLLVVAASGVATYGILKVCMLCTPSWCGLPSSRRAWLSSMLTDCSWSCCFNCSLAHVLTTFCRSCSSG